MLKQELLIESLKLSIQDDSTVKVFETYSTYFVTNFFFPIKHSSSRRMSFVKCELEEYDKKSFTVAITDLLKRIKALPDNALPIYTDTYLLVCLDLLKVKVREAFDIACIYNTVNVHKIVTNKRIMYENIEYLSSFISTDFYKKKLADFDTLLADVDLSSDEHGCRVKFINDLVNEVTAFVNA